MDPVSMIVMALAAGAAAGAKQTASQAITDAYNGVKSLIQHKYSSVDVTPLEKKPDSEPKRLSVAEDLKGSGADQDPELLARVKTLIDALEQHDRAAAATIGVDLEEVKAAYLKAEEVISTGTGVRVRKSEFSGGIELGSVRAGEIADRPNP